MSRGATLDDASRGGFVNRAGLRADYRTGRALSLREADRQLCGTGAPGEVERESKTTGAYHETREFDVALPLSRGGPGFRAQHSRMARDAIFRQLAVLFAPLVGCLPAGVCLAD